MIKNKLRYQFNYYVGYERIRLKIFLNCETLLLGNSFATVISKNCPDLLNLRVPPSGRKSLFIVGCTCI